MTVCLLPRAYCRVPTAHLPCTAGVARTYQPPSVFLIWQVWLTPAAELMSPNALPPYAIVGFVAGERAARVAALPAAEAARLLLLQVAAH